MFYSHTWNFRVKAHSTSQQSDNSKAWGWKYGYRGTFPLFLTTSLNFLFSLTMDRSFRPIEPRFPHRVETSHKRKNPLSQETFSQFRTLGVEIWVQEPSLSSSQPLPISSSRWLWVEVLDLLCFYAFSTLLLLAFWFSFVKAPLVFCSLYIWNFGLDSP